jgi:hypothetical protein
MARVFRDNWLLLAFLGVLIAAFLMLRSTPSDIPSLEALDCQLSAGQPTVLAFYSNF